MFASETLKDYSINACCEMTLNIGNSLNINESFI